MAGGDRFRRARRRKRLYARVQRARRSELAVRAGSALIMLALAAWALVLGGWAWLALVSLIGAGVAWEWGQLARRIARTRAALALWLVCGIVYVLAAGIALVILHREGGHLMVLGLAGSVVMTDVGAYFAGRAIGGPRIAPAISPSKTWAGLAGGMVLSALFLALLAWLRPEAVGRADAVGAALLLGLLIALVAQAGDFFESWMKRRAGVKDSGALIPGHGGLFDRMDGMMAVCALLALPVLLMRDGS